jgi:hypothetical protein
MTKSLETADHILKLVLAIAVVLCYSFRVITGALATGLFILALAVIIFFLAQVLMSWLIRD